MLKQLSDLLGSDMLLLDIIDILVLGFYAFKAFKITMVVYEDNASISVALFVNSTSSKYCSTLFI